MAKSYTTLGNFLTKLNCRTKFTQLLKSVVVTEFKISTDTIVQFKKRDIYVNVTENKKSNKHKSQCLNM